MRLETYQPLLELDWLTHAFSLRADADTKQSIFSDQFVVSQGFHPGRVAAAEQVHGNGVAVVDAPAPDGVPGVDGLITQVAGLPLVIRCADCAAVFFVDLRRRAIGLVHSGKRGTQANIVQVTLDRMHEAYGTAPADCRVLISPCIGPCHYEYDLWETLRGQLDAAGVADVHHQEICTACHLDRYYSYRAEKGQTGRMFALLAMRAH